VLAFNEQEEKVIDKILSVLAGYIQLEAIQTVPASALSFSDWK